MSRSRIVLTQLYTRERKEGKERKQLEENNKEERKKEEEKKNENSEIGRQFFFFLFDSDVAYRAYSDALAYSIVI